MGHSLKNDDCLSKHWSQLGGLDAIFLKAEQAGFNADEIVFELVRQLRSHHFLELLWVCFSWKRDEVAFPLEIDAHLNWTAPFGRSSGGSAVEADGKSVRKVFHRHITD